jgi:protein-S-isoprenylcysteine O-methyltransferase Ste14
MSLFRVAKARSPLRHLLHTALQASVFWTLAIVALPLAVVHVERSIGLPSIAWNGRVVVGGVIAVALGLMNLGSGVLMALKGEGTPLPLATARKLVVVGPYARVRNPMAVGGLGAGIGVGLALGSWATIVLCFLAGVFWHVAVRPSEERDLLARMGEDYRRYQHAVPLWMPRLKPYRPGDDADQTSRRES